MLPLSHTQQPSKRLALGENLGVFIVRWLPLALLMAFGAGSVLFWLHLNVAPFGRDAGGHLATSLHYLPLLESPSPRTFFEVMLVNGYRPPLFYLATLPFYALFGTRFDSALYANVGWLLLTLAGIYALGRQLRGHGTGLLAAGIYLLFPFVHGLARLFYFESALTAFVAFTLALHLATRHFAERRWALAWGLSLGLGMLAKWTLPATIGLPTLYLLWRGGFLHETARAMHRPTIAWKALLASLLVGSALALLFLWPSRDLVVQTTLGTALYPLFALIWGLTLYTLSRPARPLTNLVSGLGVAASVMALWYLVQIGFVFNFVDAAYLGADGRDAEFQPFALKTYVYYLRYLFQQLIGPLLTLLLLPLLWPWLRVLWRRRGLEGSDSHLAIALWLAVGSTYLAFTFARYNSERSMLALLVPLAVLLAAGAMALRPLFRTLLLVAALGVGLAQWALYTLPDATQVPVPPLFARGEFLQPPASGATDPGYWLAPDVLATIAASEGGPASFGMLVNSVEIHRGPYRYLIDAQALDIELTALTEKTNQWGDLFAQQWILVKDGSNHDVEEPGRAAIARIASGDGLFELLYRVGEQYPLPNGDTATLYHRVAGPAFPRLAPDWMDATAPLADALNRWWTPDSLLLLPDPNTSVWLAAHGLRADRAMWLESGTIPDDATLLFALLTPDMHDARARLEQQGYHALDVPGERATLALYGQPHGPLTEIPVRARWGSLRLAGLRSQPTLHTGEVLPLELRLTGEIPPTLKLSVRLLDPSGATIAQNDRAVSESVRLGLFLPPDAAPGSYTVALVLYDSATLEALPNEQGTAETQLFALSATASAR